MGRKYFNQLARPLECPRCHRQLHKHGMHRELARGARPGPGKGMLRTFITSVGMECPACRCEWLIRVLWVPVDERWNTRVPNDGWQIWEQEQPGEALERVLQEREVRKPDTAPTRREPLRPMTEEEAASAREWIARLREQLGEG